MADNDDEPDYLSDEILQQCVKNDIRPGLLLNRASKRTHEQMKKHEDQIKKNVDNNPKQKEEKLRNEGLEQKIPSSNKGFQMLTKMGYKPGDLLGKSMEGLSEPVKPEVKANREGVGHVSKAKIFKVRTKQDEEDLDKKRELDVIAFRERMSQNRISKEIYTDLHRAKHACKSLDLKFGVETPEEPWFWPIDKDKCDTDEDTEEQQEDSSEEEDDDNDVPEEKQQLETLVDYLKNIYFYCIWCGIQYSNQEDVELSCPGPTKDCH